MKGLGLHVKNKTCFIPFSFVEQSKEDSLRVSIVGTSS
jgi:hypothetical protein